MYMNLLDINWFVFIIYFYSFKIIFEYAAFYLHYGAAGMLSVMGYIFPFSLSTELVQLMVIEMHVRSCPVFIGIFMWCFLLYKCVSTTIVLHKMPVVRI